MELKAIEIDESDKNIFNEKYYFEDHRSTRFTFQGLPQDLETLRFISAKSDLSFESFASAWREMQFINVFNYRYTVSEMIEYAEGLLHYVKGYVFAKKMESTVFGIYVMYAVYCRQPMKNFRARPRLTLSELKRLKTIYKSMGAREAYRDAQAIIAVCFNDNIFEIVSNKLDAGMEYGYTPYFKLSDYEKQEIAKELPFDESLLADYKKASESYAEQINSLCNDDSKPFSTESDFVHDMLKLMEEFSTGAIASKDVMEHKFTVNKTHDEDATTSLPTQASTSSNNIGKSKLSKAGKGKS